MGGGGASAGTLADHNKRRLPRRWLENVLRVGGPSVGRAELGEALAEPRRRLGLDRRP